MSGFGIARTRRRPPPGASTGTGSGGVYWRRQCTARCRRPERCAGGARSSPPLLGSVGAGAAVVGEVCRERARAAARARPHRWSPRLVPRLRSTGLRPRGQRREQRPPPRPIPRRARAWSRRSGAGRRRGPQRTSRRGSGGGRRHATTIRRRCDKSPVRKRQELLQEARASQRMTPVWPREYRPGLRPHAQPVRAPPDGYPGDEVSVGGRDRVHLAVVPAREPQHPTVGRHAAHVGRAARDRPRRDRPCGSAKSTTLTVPASRFVTYSSFASRLGYKPCAPASGRRESRPRRTSARRPPTRRRWSCRRRRTTCRRARASRLAAARAACGNAIDRTTRQIVNVDHDQVARELATRERERSVGREVHVVDPAARHRHGRRRAASSADPGSRAGCAPRRRRSRTGRRV